MKNTAEAASKTNNDASLGTVISALSLYYFIMGSLILIVGSSTSIYIILAGFFGSVMGAAGAILSAILKLGTTKQLALTFCTLTTLIHIALAAGIVIFHRSESVAAIAPGAVALLSIAGISLSLKK